MTCLEVSINGDVMCTAGLKEFGVLAVLVELARRKAKAESVNDDAESGALKIRVGGVEVQAGGLSEQVDWVNRHINVGDVITIRIVDAPHRDEPSSRETIDE